jgi:hypothetical protein
MNPKVYGVLDGRLAFFGEAIGFDEANPSTLYVELPEDKKGRRPVMELANFESRCIVEGI